MIFATEDSFPPGLNINGPSGSYDALRKEVRMLLELSVIPLGRGRSISTDIVDLVKIIDASRLDDPPGQSSRGVGTSWWT